MCKKIVIAALAVGLGLAVVKGTWFGSHVRNHVRQAFHKVKNSIPPEQEIARLKMELRNLSADDDSFFDKVARMKVGVDKLDRDVASLKKGLQAQETRLRGLHQDLTGDKTFVVSGGVRYTKDDLRAEGLTFKAAEESLKSKEESLEAKRKHLALEKKKLAELRSTREQMATELQRLETALAEERHAQAASESTIDDSGYRKLRKDMDSVRERIEILKTKRALRGEFPAATPKDDQARERDTKADKFLQERFGKTKEVVEGNEGN
jgi:chromosome segregation ATPase